MKTKFAAFLLVPLALSLAACGDTWGERAATGGAIGAGSGLAVGAVAGWPLIGPALVGGALGAGLSKMLKMLRRMPGASVDSGLTDTSGSAMSPRMR